MLWVLIWINNSQINRTSDPMDIINTARMDRGGKGKGLKRGEMFPRPLSVFLLLSVGITVK